MLENLFRNAVEHGGEEVTVRVGDLPTGFYVEDDGTGISETARKSVFDVGYTTETGESDSVSRSSRDWSTRTIGTVPSPKASPVARGSSSRPSTRPACGTTTERTDVRSRLPSRIRTNRGV
ncbi:ATP-binding protein [Haladaptatus halobius]|uniref:ATP-binding protein n=1 Tax=Haladaptatus halobius TaxID=2884875 RepID=UPI002105610E|nr:ATP-binding protein [Haladaptatus halobius]